MNKRTTLFLAISLAGGLALGACGNETVKRAEALKDKICECKDMECADKVETTLRGLKDAVKKLEEDDLKEIMKIGKAADACKKKLS